jgi:hypothetical protein
MESALTAPDTSPDAIPEPPRVGCISGGILIALFVAAIIFCVVLGIYRWDMAVRQPWAGVLYLLLVIGFPGWGLWMIVRAFDVSIDDEKVVAGRGWYRRVIFFKDAVASLEPSGVVVLQSPTTKIKLNPYAYASQAAFYSFFAYKCPELTRPPLQAA